MSSNQHKFGCFFVCSLFATASLQQQNSLSDLSTHIPLHTPHQPIEYSQQYQYNPSNHLQVQIHRPQPMYPLLRNGVGYNPYIRFADTEYANHLGNYTNYGKHCMYQSWMQQLYPNTQIVPNLHYASQQYAFNQLDNQSRCVPSLQYSSPHDFDQFDKQSPRNTPTVAAHNTHTPVDVKPVANLSPLLHDNRFTEVDESSHTTICAKPKNMKRKTASRPMNSFMLYSKVHRNKVHTLYPHLDNRTVSKLLGETWYQMQQGPKCQYTNLAAELKKEHSLYHPDFDWKSEVTVNADDNITPDDPDTSDSFDAERSGSSSNKSGPCTVTYDDCSEDTPSPGSITDQWTPSMKVLKLAPTPAQLRRKRAQAEDSVNAEKIDSPTISTASSEDNFTQNLLFKYQSRINALPRFDFTAYKLPEWAQKTAHPSPYNTEPYKKRYQYHTTRKLTGERFFGPNFDLDGAKGNL